MPRPRPKLSSSYEDLLSGYYGQPTRPPETLEAVIGRDGRSARVILSHRDDGETLHQHHHHHGHGGHEHHHGHEEHHHHGHGHHAHGHEVAAERLTPSVPPWPAASAPAASPPAEPPVAPQAAAASPPPPAAAGAPAPSPTPASMSTGGGVDEHELAADMKAILSGLSVYDPASGRTVPRGEVGGPSLDPPPRNPTPADPPDRRATAPDPSATPASNPHAIFDAIAQSMQYANAYDLGTVDLDDRLDDFDRLSDLDEHDTGGDRPRAHHRDRRRDGDGDADDRSARGLDPHVGPGDVLNDIDAIRAGAEARVADGLRTAAEGISRGLAADTCLVSATQFAAAAHEPLEQPMYDTGEHALAAADIYAAPLLIGASPGVSVRYAQIVTMADLYESVDQMMAASAAELSGLKVLIERDTAHYRDGSATSVGNDEWERATGGRYLDLAERNYTHFAPDVLFNDAIAGAGTRHSNHREAWEAHHRLALTEARGGPADPPAHAMIVNAFGDHFLTDAFAAGHLINKDAVANYFKHNFLSGGDLTPPASAFFDRVAQRAFVGAVREKFSRLETTAAHYLVFHPNIDSPSRFATLLKEACKQQPDRVANMAIKAIHDHLNSGGIEVVNDAGDGPWRLTGDGHLTAQTMAIMKRAVQASVDNVRDPALRVADDATCFGRVWRFTPKLTAASRPTVVALVQDLTNPASTRLSDAAADLITREVDQLIHVLVDQQHQLRPA